MARPDHIKAVARDLVEAFRDHRDADVYNVIDAHAGSDARPLLWALVRLAADDRSASSRADSE